MIHRIQGEYHGQSRPLFLLYFKTACLTLFTLGIYRFWAKTRVRKYIWSAVAADGDSFEYTGTGLEKFLGFLVAVVILAVYLGVIQMVLFYFGLTLMSEPTSQTQALAQILAIYITLLAVLPLFFFAQYRARRYKMARTRWRGIRFGMDNGAWGYVWRALCYYALSLVTVGVLAPFATFRLEKYKVDRTWYGDARFEQFGRWQSLYGGFKHVLIGLGIIVGGVLIGAFSGLAGAIIIGLAGFVGYIWMLLGLVYYRVYAFNYLTRHKLLDGHVTFVADAQTGFVVKTAIIGSIVVGLLFALIFGIVAGLTYSAQEQLMAGQGFASIIVSALLYVVAILITGGLNLVMIIQPIIEHVVSNVRVEHAEHLGAIQQRVVDQGADAEGFADALDVGGAI